MPQEGEVSPLFLQLVVACFKEINQNVNDLVFRDNVEYSTSVKLFFFDKLTKFFMVSFPNSLGFDS